MIHMLSMVYMCGGCDTKILNMRKNKSLVLGVYRFRKVYTKIYQSVLSQNWSNLYFTIANTKLKVPTDKSCVASVTTVKSSNI